MTPSKYADTATECAQCRLIGGTRPEHVIYEHAHSISSPAPLDPPAWMMLSAKEPVAGQWNMTDSQAATFGPAVRTVTSAIQQVTGADRVYIFFFGDNSIHFHVALVPLTPGAPSIFDLKTMEREATEAG